MPTLEETINSFLGNLVDSKTTEFNIPFTELNGMKGDVRMDYMVIPEDVSRKTPGKKELFLTFAMPTTEENIEEITSTLKRISNAQSKDQLTITIKLHPQNEIWKRHLERTGWQNQPSGGTRRRKKRKSTRRR